MWTPLEREQWWRASHLPARTSSGSAPSIRWARASTALKPTGRRPHLSTVAYSHVVHPSLQFFCVFFFFFYAHAWSTTGLLCPITLCSAAAPQDCHSLSVFSVTDPPPTVASVSCCGRNHSTVGFSQCQASALTSRSNQTPSCWFSRVFSCGRLTPHSHPLLWGSSASNVAKQAFSGRLVHCVSHLLSAKSHFRINHVFRGLKKKLKVCVNQKLQQTYFSMIT